jgi:crossover junction endodeoxyribonuclease RusA
MLLEFTVPGPPVSHQSCNRVKLAEWRERVRSLAAKEWKSGAPLEIQLKIMVAYYHEGQRVRIDNDNLVKPIQDALIGLIYRDDRCITDTIIRKTSIDGAFQVRGQSLVLLEAFHRRVEFVHIVVEQAPSHESPLK